MTSGELVQSDITPSPGTVETRGFRDAHPGRPRVLFIGSGDSSHEHAWIDLLSNASMNVRFFARHGDPGGEVVVPVYLAGAKTRGSGAPERRRLYRGNRAVRYVQTLYSRVVFGSAHRLSERWLAQIIRDWKPDVIHTFGMKANGHFFRRVREQENLRAIGTWVLQTRGGSDFELARFDSLEREEMEQTLRACDQLICDNPMSYQYATELGVRPEQMTPVGPVPGTGGIDLGRIGELAPPSKRNVIIWPKAYDSAWSRSLQVIEALRELRSELDGFEIHAMATCEVTRMWIRSLPSPLRERILIHGRVKRAKLLELTRRARVSISPSLVDGVPNTLIEAMAYGAVPIVSPLKTITPLVADGRNVLFARNLYPDEIAHALECAISDDELADEIAGRNTSLVATFADRSAIRRRIVDLYTTLARDGVGS